MTTARTSEKNAAGSTFPLRVDSFPSHQNIHHENYPCIKALVGAINYNETAKFTYGKRVIQELRLTEGHIIHQLEAFRTKIELIDSWISTYKSYDEEEEDEEFEEDSIRKKKQSGLNFGKDRQSRKEHKINHGEIKDVEGQLNLHVDGEREISSMSKLGQDNMLRKIKKRIERESGEACLTPPPKRVGNSKNGTLPIHVSRSAQGSSTKKRGVRKKVEENMNINIIPPMSHLNDDPMSPEGPCSTTGLWKFIDRSQYFMPISMKALYEILSIEHDDAVETLRLSPAPPAEKTSAGDRVSSKSKAKQNLSASRLETEASLPRKKPPSSFEDDPAFTIPSVTQRLLSALITTNEENSRDVSIDAAESARVAFTKPLIPLCFENCTVPERIENYEDGTTPPTSENGWESSARMSLEQRLRIELRMIGLLDKKDDKINLMLGNPEDDAICIEARELSRELKDQIRHNNECRAKLRNQVQELISSGKFGSTVQQIEESRAIEKRYQKMWKTRQEAIKKKQLKAKKWQKQEGKILHEYIGCMSNA